MNDVVPDLRRRAQARVDLDAIRGNVGSLRSAAGSAEVMAVVKADGYGHGMVPVARAAVSAGATWLGVAVLEEALRLRAAGLECRVFCWLAAPGEDFGAAVAVDVDLSASAPWAVDQIAAGARTAGRRARLHLKVDSGLGRGGAAPADWAHLVEVAAKEQASGSIEVVGLWSHLACADEPQRPENAAQVAAFRSAIEIAERAGLRPEVRHLANSAGTMGIPATHFDLVRPGIAVYGCSPSPAVTDSAGFGLRPAMTLVARLAHVKRVPAGHGVSYGHTYVTSRQTTLGLVPVGYADGIPRAAGNQAPLWAAGARRRIAGRVCMDQFVVDLGDDPACVGDEVVLFGTGESGEPTAQEWADAIGTISYEIVTRIGERIPRVYLGNS
ncbi:MAG TPA: alanine racemase [Sporichthyaceae bacterium]|jgi:alanine racemase|nr:alanine racemase [Sporichthyaceae bacterium]